MVPSFPRRRAYLAKYSLLLATIPTFKIIQRAPVQALLHGELIGFLSRGVEGLILPC